MSTANLFALLFTLTALFSYLNSRTIRIPQTLGILLFGLLLSLLVDAAGWLGYDITPIVNAVKGVPFDEVVMKWLLSFLLFASAIQADVRWLLRETRGVMMLAVGTTLITMLGLGAGAAVRRDGGPH